MKNDSKYFSMIGAIGGHQRILLHGNPGTHEGRSRGGKNAVRVHNLKKNSAFIKARVIKPLRKNTALAEFMGILFGDGHVGKYQTVISLDSQTDKEYAKYICDLIQKYFKIKVNIRKRKDARAVDIYISSVSFCNLMVQYGMISGNKIKGDFRIPHWINKSKTYQTWFLRGLFDTDGSIYQDFRIIKERRYHGVGLLWSSASESLRKDILRLLSDRNMGPTGGKGKHRSIYLRKKANIIKYFKEIGTSNPKHSERYNRFIGEVAHLSINTRKN